MIKLKHIHLIVAFALVFALGPTAGWSNRVFTDKVTGQITAVPVADVIEVDHKVYHIKAGSLADKELHEFAEGQRVDLVLDGDPTSKTSKVLKITIHINTP